MYQMHMTILWICAFFEIFYYTSTLVSLASVSPIASTVLCPHTDDPHLRVTPMFTIGFLAVLLGSYIRLDCFKTLGQLFTFDLTIHPEHKLITSRFYGWVRHPAVGQLLLSGSTLLILLVFI